jgi:eukaryotic-like serine/threonine-protein kinase
MNGDKRSLLSIRPTRASYRYPRIRHRNQCHDVQFSPGGRLVGVASYDGSVRVRVLATGGDSLGAAVTRDGKHAVVGGFQDVLAVLDLNGLATADVAADVLSRWSERLSSQRLHEGGGTVNLSAAEWLDR